MHRHDTIRRLIAAVAPAAIVAASLASLGANVAGGQERERVQRSTADVRQRPPDELDRPRNKERWTHRGYEIRTNQFIVVANTRVEDARWASQQMEAAWTDFSKLADAWMTSHHNPDFGIGAVQVHIDANTPKDRDLPTTTINVVGIQTQIILSVAPGQPKLEDQIYRLRKAAGQAFLHTAELDRQLPPWACDGMASYVAAEGLTKEQIEAAAREANSPASPKLGGQQWRFQRSQQDRLGVPKFDADSAAQEVEFLLTAQDAAHAPAFFAAIEQSMAQVQHRRVQGSLVTARRGEEQLAQPGPVDHLAAQLAGSFQQWQRAPLAGQPKLVLDEKTPAGVQRAERELAVVLKLARRFGMEERGSVHTRITAFNQEKGLTVLSGKAEVRSISLTDLYQRITSPQQAPWGTLDADGKLVLSTGSESIRQLLGVDENRYRRETVSGRGVLATTVDGQWKVQGWLEENKEDPSRPLAKFTVAKSQ